MIIRLDLSTLMNKKSSAREIKQIVPDQTAPRSSLIRDYFFRTCFSFRSSHLFLALKRVNRRVRCTLKMYDLD